MEALWEQAYAARKDSGLESQTAEIEKWPEYLCPCGGVKTMGYAEESMQWSEHTLPTCTSCGRCDNEYISDEPEWRGGMDDDGEVSDPSRVGAPTDDRYSESWSMGTIMNVRSTASYAQKKLARISFHTSMNYKDRSLFHNYQDLERAGKSVLGLPAYVVSEAEHMYKKFSEERLTRGAVRMGIKANCLYQACKNNNIARTVPEIAEAFGIPNKDVSRTSDMFREVIQTQVKPTVTRASNVVSRMFNDLHMIPEDERRRLRCKAVRICEQIQESMALMGKTPKTIAATVIFVLVENVPKFEVCQACGVSVPTLNKLEPIVRAEIKNIV
ncbi:transcription initiation factor IIB family protein [bacterium]|nr:transcription initiation factor IIB family protein [bacterium]NBX48745.1 transcription initiation factor IIB family protein [bacterium]